MDHLWYSKEQLRRRHSGHKGIIGELENGKKVVFTESTHSKEDKCNFDDAIYLGRGQFYSTNISDLKN